MGDAEFTFTVWEASSENKLLSCIMGSAFLILGTESLNILAFSCISSHKW